MTKGYFQRMKRQRKDTPLLFDTYALKENTVTYTVEQREEMITFMRQRLSNHFKEEQIAAWM